MPNIWSPISEVLDSEPKNVSKGHPVILKNSPYEQIVMYSCLAIYPLLFNIILLSNNSYILIYCVSFFVIPKNVIPFIISCLIVMYE